MEKILRSIVDNFGQEIAVDFVISYCDALAIRGLATSVQELPVELKIRLADALMIKGEWYDAYYFLQLVSNIPEATKDRLLDKAGVSDPEQRQILRVPIV